jgi:hypothetical protein
MPKAGDVFDASFLPPAAERKSQLTQTPASSKHNLSVFDDLDRSVTFWLQYW